MQIALSKAATKSLNRMPANRATTIRRKIDTLATTGIRGELANNIAKLQGREGYRLTVGADRVIFSLEYDVLVIEAVQPRGKAYR